MNRCERCGRRDREIHSSEAAGARVCLECHLDCDPPGVPVPDIEVTRRRRPPDPDWVAFRKRIFAALDLIDEPRFACIDEDRSVHVCPVCRTRDGWLSVRFIGRTPKAEIKCSLGCSGEQIGGALNLKEEA